MKRNEIIDKLINYFVSESKWLKKYKIPEDIKEKRLFLRGIINMRAPKPLNEEILKLEDELLQIELKQKVITDASDIKVNKHKMGLWLGDITALKIEAIVNAGNSALLGCFIPNHSCIDNQIHSMAGIRLRLACNKIMKGKEEKTGQAEITFAYNLPCRYVIHTVGPIVDGKLTDKEEKELEKCYIFSLELARKNNIRTIAFPCISTGLFHFPKAEASQIAVNTVLKYLDKYPLSFDKIIFNVFSKEDYAYYDRLLKD